MKHLLLSSLALIFCFNLSFSQAEQYEVLHDLTYVSDELVANDTLQQLNLVLPKAEEKTPLLIWIGGGAWSYVNRDMEMDLARQFASEGIAVAAVGHRLSTAVWRDSSLNKGIQHPKHVEDIASSVKWLYDHADEYGFDREQFFIGGFSSGAHLAALVTMDGKYLNQVGLSPDLFQGVIPISGTYDIPDYHSAFLNGSRPDLAELHVEAVFGNTQAAMMEASPVGYLDSLSVPMLLMSDNNVYNYTKLFEDRIRETEFRDVQVVYTYDLSHGDLWREISVAEKSMYREVILFFIEAHG